MSSDNEQPNNNSETAKTKRLDKEEAKAGENKEDINQVETAKQKAERLEYEEEMEEKVKEELVEFVDDHDKIEGSAKKKIENPQNRDLVLAENAETKKVVKGYWEELHRIEEKVDEEDEVSPVASPEQQTPDEVTRQETQEYVNETHGGEDGEGNVAEESNKENLKEDIPTEEEVKECDEYTKKTQEYINRMHDMEDGATEENVKENPEEKVSTEEEDYEDGTEVSENEKDLERYKELDKEIKECKEAGGTEEEVKKKEAEKEAIIKATKERYEGNLQSSSDYDENKDISENITEIKKKIEERLADAELTKGIENKEIKFNEIIEKGQGLLNENDPEKIKDYFGNMASVFEDCSSYAQCIYLEMEKNPEMREALHSQYVELVNSIREFDEAAKVLRELADSAKKAQEEKRGLSEQELKRMHSLLGALEKMAPYIVGFGIAVYKVAKFAHFYAVKHPKMSKAIGWSLGAIVGGSAIASAPVLTAKGLCLIAAIVAVVDENRRDRFIEGLLQYKLPKSLEAPTKSAKAA